MAVAPLVVATGAAAAATLGSLLGLCGLLDLDAVPGQEPDVLLVLLVVGIPDSDRERSLSARVVARLSTGQEVTVDLQRDRSAEQVVTDHDLCVRHAYHILYVVKN